MWLLPSVDQKVLLQVSQLGEAFVTGLAFERSLSTVDTKVNLNGKKKVYLGLLGQQRFCLVGFSCVKCFETLLAM